MLQPEDLADLIHDAVHIATASLIERVKTLESRPVVMSMEPRDGRDGKDGAPGAAGIAGPQGERGERGMDGAEGLRGKDGTNGINGKDGSPGPHGKDGRDGLGITDAFLRKDGHLALTFSDGSVRIVGSVIGPAGEKGADGTHGVDGARGSDGAAGIAGPQGERGERGSDGPIGQRGPQGEKGTDGLNGAMGERGLQGEKGADGVNGKDGESIVGPEGKPGRDGINGKDAVFDTSAFNAIEQRVVGVETAMKALPVEVSPDVLAQQFADLLKKELDAIAPPQRMQKRVIRDAAGRVERVVEEPVAR